MRRYRKKFRGGYNNNYNNKRRKFSNRYDQYNKNDINTITKSKEEGFTGDLKNIFDNKEFFKNLSGHSDFEGKKDDYFNSYSSYYIHQEMLKDKIRTGTYEDAILKNADLFKDKIVLDIGSGTGVLSIFAVKAGAKHVYSIEYADIADYSKVIISNNNLSDKITVIKAKVEEATLPVDKVDIIISEWMGYFLLYESMLDTVLYARDKWLNKETGIMLPDRASLYLSAIEDYDYKCDKLEFWDDVYGINMSCITPSTVSEPLVDECPKEAVFSNCCKIFDIDLYTVTVDQLQFASKYELTFKRSNYFSGLVGWFVCKFEKLNNKFTLTTSPLKPCTHWMHTIFYTKKDKNFKVNGGDKINGSIAVRKDHTNSRHLDIKISYHLNQQGGDWYQLYKII